MTKLNQIVAALQTVKSRGTNDLTAAYKRCQKSEIFLGINREYTPLNDEGEKLPSENQLVRTTVDAEIESVLESVNDMYDIVYTQENGNSSAKADVVVDGTTVLLDVPVTYLLFLEKQLKDLHTFVNSFPLLDNTVVWADSTDGIHRAEPVVTNRTQKVPEVLVKYEATKEHPAQTELITKDVTVGTWSTTKLSGGIDATTKKKYLDRIRKLQLAVKAAREEANSTQVDTNPRVGEKITSFVFGT